MNRLTLFVFWRLILRKSCPNRNHSGRTYAFGFIPEQLALFEMEKRLIVSFGGYRMVKANGNTAA